MTLAAVEAKGAGRDFVFVQLSFHVNHLLHFHVVSACTQQFRQQSHLSARSRCVGALNEVRPKRVRSRSNRLILSA